MAASIAGALPELPDESIKCVLAGCWRTWMQRFSPVTRWSGSGLKKRENADFNKRKEDGTFNAAFREITKFDAEWSGQMRIVAVLVLALAVDYAEGAEPKLTKEMGAKVQAGIGKLREEDLLKLFPGLVTVVAFPDGVEADQIFKWEEAASIEVVLTAG
ncbi:MAG: hypothetical protein ACREHD_12325, partial [Pirellulales bacterium]